MANLAIRLLGVFQVTLNSRTEIQFETEKTRALLAYLASEPERVHQREYLAEMFWPERPPGAARANLRHALGHMRRVLGDCSSAQETTNFKQLLLATRDTIQFNLIADVWVDTTTFEQAFLGTSKQANLRIDQLKRAVETYRGPFLEDILVGDSVIFQEWLLLKRESYRRMVLNLLRQLTDCYYLWGKYEKALEYAWRQAALAPWNEEVHQQIMRLLVLTDQRAAALSQYDTCRSYLKNELGVEPGPVTSQLYEQIRDEKLEDVKVSALFAGAKEMDSQPPGFLIGKFEEPEPPAVVAREPELNNLYRFYKEMLAGHGRVVFVSGDAGQGKTALLGEFSRRMLSTHPEVLVASGSCSAYSGAGDPYLPFRDVLAMLSGDVESRWSAGEINREHARRLWQVMPLTLESILTRSRVLIGTLLEGEALFSRAVAAMPDRTDCLMQLRAVNQQAWIAPVVIKQQALFEQFTNFLRTLAVQHPLVLILDDMQWADRATSALLFHLGRRIAKSDHKILIVCAYRPEELIVSSSEGRHPLVKVLNECKRLFGDVWVDLAKAEVRSGRSFVDDLLNLEPNRLEEEFRASLYKRTQGHPLFTIELLRAMQERGDIVKDQLGSWVQAPALNWDLLPARVRAVIEERIERLEPELQQVLNTASVEGEVFTVQIVAEIQEMAEKPLLNRLRQELEQQDRLVREQRGLITGQSNLTQYRFQHVLFRDYVYNRLSGGERRLLHRDVAAAIEKLYPGQLEEMAVQLAYHFYQAGNYRGAFRYSTMAAQRAARLYAHDEAIQHATRAIKLVEEVAPKTHVCVNLYRLRAQAYETQGLFSQALEDYSKALQIAQTANEQHLERRVLLDLGQHWASRDDHQSRGYFERALELAHQTGDPEVLACSLNWIGDWYAKAEDFCQAIAYQMQALDVIKALRDRRNLANALDILGITYELAGDSAASVGYYDSAIELFRELDDRASLASSLTGRGNNGSAIYASLANFAAIKPNQARQDFQEALGIIQEIDSPATETWLNWSMGLLEIVRGEFGNAYQILQNWLQITKEIGHQRWIVGSQAIMGILHVELFAFTEAQRYLEAALSLAQEMRSQHWILQINGTLAVVYRLTGDLDQAQACLESVISPQTPMDSMHKRTCWVRRAELALAQGQPALALDITERLIGSAPGLPPEGVITFLWMLKAEALAGLGQLEEAACLLRSAQENARLTGEHFLSWRIHASLGKVYSRMKNLEQAEDVFAAARAQINELADHVPDEGLKKKFLKGAYKECSPPE